MAEESIEDIIRTYRQNRQSEYLAEQRQQVPALTDISNEPGISVEFMPVNPWASVAKGMAAGALTGIGLRGAGRAATYYGRQMVTRTPAQAMKAEFFAARAARNARLPVPLEQAGTRFVEPGVVRMSRAIGRGASTAVKAVPGAVSASAKYVGHKVEALDDAMMKVGSFLFGADRNVVRNMPLSSVATRSAYAGAAITGGAVGGAIGGAAAVYHNHFSEARQEADKSKFNEEATRPLSPEQYNDERTVLSYLFNPETGIYNQWLALRSSSNPADVQASEVLRENMRRAYNSPWMDAATSRAYQAYAREQAMKRPKLGEHVPTEEEFERKTIDDFYALPFEDHLMRIKQSSNLNFVPSIFGGQ